MCGRYRLTEAQKFAELNDIRLGWNPKRRLKRYNIGPLVEALAVLDDKPNEFSVLTWGLVPSWSKDMKGAAKCINARGETVAEKPSFRSAFKHRRCLIPADGFYEWQKVGTGKQPFNIGLKSGEPFAFAGLWEEWNNPATPEEPLRTFSIITTTPNELMATIHDRMPVILPREHYGPWLAADNAR